jgi:hypothetical protein
MATTRTSRAAGKPDLLFVGPGTTSTGYTPGSPGYHLPAVGLAPLNADPQGAAFEVPEDGTLERLSFSGTQGSTGMSAGKKWRFILYNVTDGANVAEVNSPTGVAALASFTLQQVQGAYPLSAGKKYAFLMTHDDGSFTRNLEWVGCAVITWRST